jgi:RNA polymerase sigma-70 factor (TIGR02943 family)
MKNHCDQTNDPRVWLDRYGDFLFRYAIGQVRDAQVAEDLVQDTFLAAWKARARFQGESSERTWLVGILRHKIYDHFRERTRHPTESLDDEGEFGQSLAWIHERAADCISPSRRMELAEFRAALEQALGKLPTRIAQVFQMYEIEERTGHEVCRAMNISENNLWVMLHRARTQLREQLAPAWRA